MRSCASNAAAAGPDPGAQSLTSAHCSDRPPAKFFPRAPGAVANRTAVRKIIFLVDEIEGLGLRLCCIETGCEIENDHRARLINLRMRCGRRSDARAEINSHA